MIYLISDKYFMAKYKKLVKPKPYWCLDASTWYLSSSFKNRGYYMKSRDGYLLDPDALEDDSRKAIYTLYNNAMLCEEFSMPHEMAAILEDYDHGNKYDKDQYSLYMKRYLTREEFSIGLIKAIKIMAYPILNKIDDEEYNVFIIFQPIVYRYCINDIYKQMIRMINVSFDWLYTQDDIKEDKSILKHSLSIDKVKQLFVLARKEEINIVERIKRENDD